MMKGNSKAYPLSKDTREKVVEGQVVAKGEEITEVLRIHMIS